MSRAEPRLDAEAIRAALGECVLGREVRMIEETTSTNDSVFEAATPSTPEGLVIFAESQSAGRGQHGNRWASARGKGLWFSILLRPTIAPADAPRLTAWAARTISQTVAQNCSLGAVVKPPNDIYVGAQKIAGVLLELRSVPAAPHLGILGLGINVNHSAEDFPEELRPRAASIAMLCGHAVERAPLAIALLRSLDHTYRAEFVRETGCGAIRASQAR